MNETYTVFKKKYDRADPRLGRNVNHDSRSLNYQVEAAPLSTLKSIRHQTFIPVLDQGQLGSCVGNASTANIATGVFWPTVQPWNQLSATDAAADEHFAVELYSAATQLDPFDGTYPPTDTGSDGLSAAKVLQGRGIISGYMHATSLEAALTALAVQPVICGTEWLGDMFNPDSTGRIRCTGSLAGGHEWLMDELDVHNRYVWLRNSWSRAWGIDGRAYMTWDDLGLLLAAQGDCTIFIPNTQPAPTPTPPAPPAPPSPPAPPEPPAPVEDQKAEFVKAAQNWQESLNKFLTWYQKEG